MPSLLARFADHNFWLARYMERAENLARILDVNATFAQDGRGPEDWLPIVHLHDDTARFFAGHDAATADAVIRFYVLERDNPTSIVSAQLGPDAGWIGAARLALDDLEAGATPDPPSSLRAREESLRRPVPPVASTT